MAEYNQTATFTRPNDTTAYTANDLVANSTTANLVVPMQFQIPTPGVRLNRAILTLNSSTNTNAKFRVHMYGSSPTAANGDNGAWSTTASTYLGDFDIDCTVRAFTDTTTGIAFVDSTATPINFNSGIIYVLLEATAAYTPTANEVFTLRLIGESAT